MKKIEAIIQPSKLEELKAALNVMDIIPGLTITQVMGCGEQKGWKEFYRGTELYLNFLPKIGITIVTPDEKVDMIIDAIIDIARTGEPGDGKIFVSDVERVIRIRNGEEDDEQ
jgi:Nitrogen regulatory protein PII